MTESVCLLGSTGSIGTQVLDVVRHFPERLKINALAAGKNIPRLAGQIREFQPECVAIQDPQDIAQLQSLVPEYKGAILTGPEGLDVLAESPDTQAVVVGLVGLVGLAPSL